MKKRNLSLLKEAMMKKKLMEVIKGYECAGTI
jgi:hypothetical protein